MEGWTDLTSLLGPADSAAPSGVVRSLLPDTEPLGRPQPEEVVRPISIWDALQTAPAATSAVPIAASGAPTGQFILTFDFNSAEAPPKPQNEERPAAGEAQATLHFFPTFTKCDRQPSVESWVSANTRSRHSYLSII